MHFLCLQKTFRGSVNFFRSRNRNADNDGCYQELQRKRKAGVTGELDVSSKTGFPVYEKNARTVDLISRAILSNKFLGDISEKRLNDLIAVMYPKDVKANTRLIQEGELGSHLYVSESGNYKIDVGGTFYGSFGPGVAFGELALLYGTKRLCSIDVDTNGKVWVLDRKAFQSVWQSDEEELMKRNLDILRSISILKVLPEEVLVKMSDLIAVEFYSANTYIVREGNPGQKFYIVTGGNVKITKGTDREKELMTLQKGDYFGEKALFAEGEHFRQANAIALPPGAECYTISREDFFHYLGDMESIKNKNWQIYVSSTPPDSWVKKFRSITLADCEIEGTIGVGSYGRVELVTIKWMPSISFARKKVRKHMLTQNGHQRLIYSEKDNLKICDSPFVCKLYRTFRDTRYLYFLLEACLGGDLRRALLKKYRFQNSTVRFIAACIVEAFNYIHSRGIVYRDLKPENLLIDRSGYIKIADFGSSKKIGPYKTKTFIGTPEYIAPEMILMNSYTNAVDFWALGIVIYELLVGRTPFENEDTIEMYNGILEGFKDVMAVGILKGSTKDIVQSLLQTDPTKRLGHTKDGVKDICDHKWFGGFNWTELRNLTLASPIVPTVTSHLDLRNFDRCPLNSRPVPNDYSDWDVNF